MEVGTNMAPSLGYLLPYEGEYACAAAVLGVPNVWLEGDTR